MRRAPPGLQSLQPVPDHRPGEFQKAALQIELGQALAQMPGEKIEFFDGLSVAAAMAANHHGGCAVGHAWSLPLGGR